MYIYINSPLLATFYTLSFLDYIHEATHLLTLLTLLTLLISSRYSSTQATHATHATHLHHLLNLQYIYIYVYIYHAPTLVRALPPRALNPARDVHL